MLHADPLFPRLLGDIGATHARFASVAAPESALSDFASYPCREFDGLEAVLRHHLARLPGAAPRACALGVATPVTGDVLTMTNLNWSFSVSGLQQRLGLSRLLIVNDFAALALAIPEIPATELVQIGGGPGIAGATKAVLGAGSGLGVSGMLWSGDRWSPIVGEGGHVTLAASDETEDRVLQYLRRQHGHVSAERVLSGPGMRSLYEAFCDAAGRAAEPLQPAEISRRALAGSDPICRETVLRFLGWLGAAAGDLALTLGAQGGVYLGGGIAEQLTALLPESGFRARFEAKGRFQEYLAPIPVWMITHASDAALHGANRALDNLARSA